MMRQQTGVREHFSLRQYAVTKISLALLSRRDNHLSRRDRQIGHPVRRNASILIVALHGAFA
jgi:hypothetical protein